jgi:hypothetical protein
VRRVSSNAGLVQKACSWQFLMFLWELFFLDIFLSWLQGPT